MTLPADLRVAFVAGTLGQGGAEKQLVYMVRALREARVDVRVYSLTCGELHEAALQEAGADVVWVGRSASVVRRVVSLASAIRSFRPHVLQSAHFFANLYAGLVAPLVGAVSIGAIRNDMAHEMETNPLWGRWLLRKPRLLVANSYDAIDDAKELGVVPERLAYLPNIIDVAAFDRLQRIHTAITLGEPGGERVVVASVGRLVTAKRFDRFIDALSLARRDAPELIGCIIGDGPEADNLRAHARQRGLSADQLAFPGRRDDAPAILKQAHLFALTSEHEGFPNVLLEAMASGLPVVTTPAGDCGRVVRDGSTGYVMSGGDVRGLAGRLVELAKSPALREKLGREGRRVVEEEYGRQGLADRLLSIYQRALPVA